MKATRTRAALLRHAGVAAGASVAASVLGQARGEAAERSASTAPPGRRTDEASVADPAGWAAVAPGLHLSFASGRLPPQARIARDRPGPAADETAWRAERVNVLALARGENVFQLRPVRAR
jgi:hypothetical protein